MHVGMNYINGSFCPHSPDFSSLNPCTELEVGLYPISGHEEVREAVDSARCAFDKWRKLSRVKRAEYFDTLSQLVKANQSRLAEAISIETGKNLNEANAEVVEALHMCQYAAASGRQPYGRMVASELSEKDSWTFRKPKGVVAVISPWNFPLAIGSFWCSAPAIVEGNCVVHKPSEYTPMVAQIAAELYDQAGFPPGVYNLIHGMDATGRELVRDNHVDVILFTGSAEVGREIRGVCAQSWNKTCSCELGSKSAVMAFEDGDIDLAVDVSVASAFKLSGQRCVSASRLLVQRSMLQDFVDEYVDKVSGLKVGDPFEKPAPYFGPLISSEAVKKVEYYNNLVANDSDVKVLLQGHRMNRDGYFLTPTVYQCEWADKPFLKQEVFGPHVAIIPFDDIDHAIQIYNDTDYGLALGAVTDDFRKHRQLAVECDTGMLYINGGSIAAESHQVFGGVKKSGNGYKSAAGTYLAVTEEIVVTTNYEEGKISWAQGMK